MALVLNGVKIYGITEENIETVKAYSHLTCQEIEKQFHIPYRRVAEIKALNLRITRY
jgi:hypothetical protein